MNLNKENTLSFYREIKQLGMLLALAVLLIGCVGATQAVQSEDSTDIYEFSVNYSLYDIQNIDSMTMERINEIKKTHNYSNHEIIEEGHPIPGLLRKDYKVRFW